MFAKQNMIIHFWLPQLC